MTGVVRYIFAGVEAGTVLQLAQQKEPIANMAILFPGDKKLLQELYATLSNQSRGFPIKFFFVVTGEELAGDRVEEIGRFFFLPNYFSAKINAPVVAFLKQPSRHINESITSWSRMQGFNRPCPLIANDFQQDETTDNPLLTVKSADKGIFFSSFYYKLKSLQWIQQVIMINVDNVNEAILLNEELKEFKESFSSVDSDTYNFLAAFAKLDQDYKNNLIKLGFLEQEVHHLKSFNTLLKDSSETNKILQFYHTQYEILPLWYKRFGHLIKIIMGKRKLSFSSKRRGT